MPAAGRLGTTMTRARASAGGNGMGLLFCQRVLQSAGGSVRVESTLGSGTTVLLSFERAVEPVAAEALEQGRVDRPLASHARHFIDEDHADDRQPAKQVERD